MASSPPLKGIKVLEFAGLAPGPFAGLLLADAGASVLRVDRAGSGHTTDMLTRHKSSIAVDLKNPSGIALLKQLLASTDVLIDPFRPGVLERLGLGPEVALAINPRLIYGRMTGYRRDGKYALMAGHDINYLAVSGALSMLGRAGDKPHPPVNILGDFAGGGAVLVQGVLMALLARHASGKGQVVEANMVDGAAYLATSPRFLLKTPVGNQPRGRNMLDGGVPWYDTYETADGKHVAVGALEPQFFAQLLRGLDMAGQGWEDRRGDDGAADELRRLFDAKFRARTRAEWERVFDGTDACVAPVLEYGELEADAAREGDQRPIVTLRDTPCLAVSRTKRSVASDSAHGQGGGVDGDGYEGQMLEVGAGGHDALRQWAGWTEGKQYEVRDGAVVWKSHTTAKL